MLIDSKFGFLVRFPDTEIDLVACCVSDKIEPFWTDIGESDFPANYFVSTSRFKFQLKITTESFRIYICGQVFNKFPRLAFPSSKENNVTIDVGRQGLLASTHVSSKARKPFISEQMQKLLAHKFRCDCGCTSHWNAFQVSAQHSQHTCYAEYRLRERHSCDQVTRNLVHHLH